MSTTSAPRGLQPVKMLGGRYNSHGATLYKIPAGYATAIFNGDPVIMTASGSTRGTIARMNATVTATTITSSGTWLGVFIGCEYVDPTTKQPTWRQYYPGSITPASGDIIAHVIDDPDALFEIQADGTLAQTALGTNAAIIQTAVGNTTTGNSGLQLDASSIENTSTLPLRIVDFVTRPGSAIGDTYTDVIVRLNTHFHRTATGVASS